MTPFEEIANLNREISRLDDLIDKQQQEILRLQSIIRNKEALLRIVAARAEERNLVEN